jgi:hypothetical protein
VPVYLASLRGFLSLPTFPTLDPANIQRQVASIESRLFATYYAVNNDRYYLRILVFGVLPTITTRRESLAKPGLNIHGLSKDCIVDGERRVWTTLDMPHTPAARVLNHDKVQDNTRPRRSYHLWHFDVWDYRDISFKPGSTQADWGLAAVQTPWGSQANAPLG